MAIRRFHQPSDLQKRLKLLEYQLYGKKEKFDVRNRKLDKEIGSLSLENQSSNFQPQYPASSIQHPTSSSDVAYLRQDLTKIFILASIAIVAEGLLYFGGRFNFFKNILI